MFMAFGKNIEKESPKGDNDKSDNRGPVQNTNMLNTPSILTGLSHEVRTYMNSIVAFTFLSNNETCSDEERREYNNHIMNSCDQLITLFDNFLDSALIDSEVPRSTITKVRLKDLLKGLLDELDNSLNRFDKKNVTLIMDERSGDDFMYIDREKINRVLKNLLFNAMETTESGYIKIGYIRHRNRVEYYVIDSGNGYTRNSELLNCKNLGKYINRYQNTFTTVSFILTQKLIESMGGRYWIKPNGDDGSCIYFSIPDHGIIKNEKSNSILSRIAI